MSRFSALCLIGMFCLVAGASAQESRDSDSNLPPGNDWVPKFEVRINSGFVPRTWEDPYYPDTRPVPGDDFRRTEPVPPRIPENDGFGPRPGDTFGPGDNRKVPDPATGVEEVAFQTAEQMGMTLKCDSIEIKANSSPLGTITYELTSSGPAMLLLDGNVTVRCTDVKAGDGRLTFKNGRIEAVGTTINVSEGSFAVDISSVEIRKHGLLVPTPTYSTTGTDSRPIGPLVPSTVVRPI